jgi:hypothetical protein
MISLISAELRDSDLAFQVPEFHPIDPWLRVYTSNEKVGQRLSDIGRPGVDGAGERTK